MKKSILTIGLLSVTLSLFAACAQRPKTVEADVVKTEVQQVEDAQTDLAPDFELPDLQGNPLKLSSLRGKYVVLDFWGSWCIWCIRGIPGMKEAYSKYKDKMEILGVDCQDTEEKWKAAVEEHQLPCYRFAVLTTTYRRWVSSIISKVSLQRSLSILKAGL